MLKLTDFGKTQKYVYYRQIGSSTKQVTLKFDKATQEELKSVVKSILRNQKNHSLLLHLFQHSIEQLNNIVNAPDAPIEPEKDK